MTAGDHHLPPSPAVCLPATIVCHRLQVLSPDGSRRPSPVVMLLLGFDLNPSTFTNPNQPLVVVAIVVVDDARYN